MEHTNKQPESELEVTIREITASHEDDRRVLKKIFNGDFTARQAILYEVKTDSKSGGHYHTYDEIWTVLKGKIDYTLIDINTGKRKTLTLNAGQSLTIPKETYHEAKVYEGTTLLGFTEEKYVSDQINNQPFKNG